MPAKSGARQASAERPAPEPMMNVHGQVLDRLHEQIDALDFGQLRLHPADNVAGVGLALL